MTMICGADLEVTVFADHEVSLGERAIAFGVHAGVARTSDFFSEVLPLPPGAHVELDATLDDAAPPSSCDGVVDAPVRLSLEHVRGGEATWRTEEVRVRANGKPLEAHVALPSCGTLCVGKGDASGLHYEYVCQCRHEPYVTSLAFTVRNRTLYAEETRRVAGPGGRHEVEGVVSVPCTAHLVYPPGTEILAYNDGYFADSSEEVRAREERDAEFDRQASITPR